MTCQQSLLEFANLLASGITKNNDCLVMPVSLHRLMADGQSATYILNEEKKESGQLQQSPEKKRSVRKHRSFKKITPPPGVPKVKNVPKLAQNP